MSGVRGLRRRRLGQLALALGFAVSACSTGPGPSNPRGWNGADKIRVVATISIFADFTRAVGGERVEVRTIVPVGGDPHVYEPRPSDARAIAGADLVVTNGLNLSPALAPLIDASARDGARVVLTEGLERRIKSIFDEEAPDPHLWMDPTLALGYIANIEAALQRVDPDHFMEYRARADRYRRTLVELDRWMADQIATIPADNRNLVTSHDAFRYFTARYNLTAAGSVWTASTDEEPSASRIRSLVTTIRTARVPTVFVESTINPSLMHQVARSAGVRIGAPLYGDSVGEPGSPTDTYESMMRANTVAIVTGLGGTVTEL